MATLVQFLQKLFFHPFFIPILLLSIFLYNRLPLTRATQKNRPPSPPQLPIIGNFHQLGVLVHRSLQSLSQQYGRLLLLHLGSKPVIVVSSADVAQQIMRTNDVTFSNRPESRATTRLFYNGKDMAFAPYGDQWRKRRSICFMDLLSNQKVKSFSSIREEESTLMIEKIMNLSCFSSVVNLREIIMAFTTDVLFRTVLGWRYSTSRNRDEKGVNVKELLNEAMVFVGVFSLGDFIPLLCWVDRVKGFDGRMEKVANGLDEFLEKTVKEHQKQLGTEKNMNDTKYDQEKSAKNFVENLLEYDVLAPGIDTTFTLIEWTMSELIKHPRVMKKLQQEVRKTVKSRVSENDLENLTYLKAVIKEALRLHPPAPLLLYRESTRDAKIDGYDIDAGTQVIINAWAIQRDSMYWDEPEDFYPERFLTSKASSIDFKGQDFQFIPFGSGRRICPGMSFAMINAELAVANLVYEFDWKLPDGEECWMLDMAEKEGINVQKRNPLMVIATPYPCK
ncbi:Cytochrome P450 71A25 [Bienertia sinuspersici]